jgi:cytochrome c peroxidase
VTGMSLSALAASPAQILSQLQAEAGDNGSAERGKTLFLEKFSGTKVESCAACHTPNPKASGRHVRTHKTIEPLAPSANPQRFTDMAKVEKWFKRNCNEVLSRACTPREKVDFVAYMLSEK